MLHIMNYSGHSINCYTKYKNSGNSPLAEARVLGLIELDKNFKIDRMCM